MEEKFPDLPEFFKHSLPIDLEIGYFDDNGVYRLNEYDGNHDNQEDGDHDNQDVGNHDNRHDGSHDNINYGSHDNEDDGNQDNQGTDGNQDNRNVGNHDNRHNRSQDNQDDGNQDNQDEGNQENQGTDGRHYSIGDCRRGKLWMGNYERWFPGYGYNYYKGLPQMALNVKHESEENCLVFCKFC